MIRALLTFSLTQRLAAMVLTVVSIGLGWWAWTTLKKEAYPDVGDTQVVVITTFPGRAAVEVEQQITLPLERVLNAVPRVITRRSKTIFGLSVIQITFDDGVDDYWARARVLEKLADAELPDGVQPALGPLTSPVGEIFRYVIEADVRYTPMDVRTVQDWTVLPRLLQCAGVADVINFGGLVKQYHVITAPDKLQRYGLTLQTVIDAVQANNLNTGGNVIRRGEEGFAVRSIGAIRTKDDILAIVLAEVGGVPVFVRDVATVEEFPFPANGVLGYAIHTDSVRDEVQSGVQGLIAMRRGENASEVVEALKTRVAEINDTELPPGMHLRITYDRSELVNYTIETVSHTLFEGFSIVIIVLVFFIGSVRAALVVATTIPVSLLFAFLLMKFTGINANLLSLGAIDFGIIVDGAVVMVENLMRRYREATPEERGEGIVAFTLHTAQEVANEIFFSIAIIVLAYLPIFTFERVEGRLFSPMAYTLAYAILGSMLLALTVIPVLMTFIYRRYFQPGTPEYLHPHSIEWHNPVYAWIERVYSRAVAWCNAQRWLTALTAFAVVIVVAVVGYVRLGTEFLPELDEGAMNIRCFFPVGVTLQQASSYTPLIRKVIGSHPQVKVIITQLGRNDDGTDPYGPNRMEMLIGLQDYATWAQDTSKTQLLLTVKRQLQQAIPGAKFSFSQPILDNVTEAVTGSVADVAILINGQDMAFMRKKADSILAIVRTIEGASESGIEQEGNQPQMVVNIDRAACARFGINVATIQSMIEAAVGGKEVSTLYDEARRFDIVVRYTPEYRATIDAVRELLISSPTGGRMPLSQLASISLQDGPTIIQRQDGKRQITVRTNIRGRDQGSFVAEAQAKTAHITKNLPKGYAVAWGGQYENLSRAGKRLVIVIPLTIAIITVLLFWLYKNFRHVTVALASIPFALAGGLVALLVRGYNFNVSSGVGFISLFGISIMSGVLYVSRANLLVRGGMHVREAALQAAVIQLRPRLMTMTLALLGLIPAARATGIGSDVQRPLATVIVGGLCSALVLTLLALPSLYLLLEDREQTSGSSTNKPPQDAPTETAAEA
jgi:cobalt-zinc-cadmium resistance protein CzcA